MQTHQANYLEYLETPGTQLSIPVFQRQYSWGVWQCEELWEDILRAGAASEEHFIGSIVYTEEPACGERGIERLFNVVDGQQRTTTVSLLLIALREHLAASGGSVCGLNARDIDERFLHLQGADGRAPKLAAAPADQATYASLLDGAPLPARYKVSSCMTANCAFFKEKLAALEELEQLWRGMERLFAIIVLLDGDDDPQLIFEGINSKGMSLATSDLLRNKLFYGADEAEQQRLLEQYWEPIEAIFDNGTNQLAFNAALRCWLVGKDPSLERHNRHELYSVFRKFVNESYEGTIEELMAELLEHCRAFKEQIRGPQVKCHLDWAVGEAPAGAANRIFGIN